MENDLRAGLYARERIRSGLALLLELCAQLHVDLIVSFLRHRLQIAAIMLFSLRRSEQEASVVFIVNFLSPQLRGGHPF